MYGVVRMLIEGAALLEARWTKNVCEKFNVPYQTQIQPPKLVKRWENGTRNGASKSGWWKYDLFRDCSSNIVPTLSIIYFKIPRAKLSKYFAKSRYYKWCISSIR